MSHTSSPVVCYVNELFEIWLLSCDEFSYSSSKALKGGTMSYFVRVGGT